MGDRRAHDEAGDGDGGVGVALPDNQCSVENVTRFARNAGYQVQVSDLDGDCRRIEIIYSAARCMSAYSFPSCR